MMRLSEAATAWDASMAAWGAASKTRQVRRTLLERLERGGWCEVRDVKRIHVETFLGTPGFSAATRVTYYNHLRAFFGWAHEVGVIDSNPMVGVRRPRAPETRPKPLTPEEVDATVTAARGDVRAWLVLALYAGLRAHEIAKLRGEDVTEDHIFVKGKGGKEAYVPTHPRVWELAARYPRRGLWFPSRVHPGEAIPADTVTIMVGRTFRRVGIAKGSIHRCRHTYATLLLRRGANLRVVQELMRHESLATTEVYLGVDETELRDAVASL